MENFGLRSSLRDFGTATDCGSDFIFLLTSFFNDSIHQLVATNHRCKISMNNGRENRTNGNQEEGEKEKEALRKVSTKSNRGTQIASPKFFCGLHSPAMSYPGFAGLNCNSSFLRSAGEESDRPKLKPSSAALLRSAPDLGCASLLQGTDCGTDRSRSDNQPSD
jgi:hypothetical protein